MVLPALSLTVRLWPVILLPVFESQESKLEGLGFCDRRREKRPSTELSEITNVVSRLILANPYIAFKYIVDGNEVLNTMGKGLDEAVFILYGRNCMENCFRVENELAHYRT